MTSLLLNSSHRSTSNTTATQQLSSPVEEFNQIFDRIEHCIISSRESYYTTLIETSKVARQQQLGGNKNNSNDATTTPIRKGLARFLIRGRSSTTDVPLPTTPTRNSSTATATTTAAVSSSPSPSPLRKDPPNTGPIADFIPMTHIDTMVEDLRRIAELCVIGENFVTTIQKKQDMALSRSQRKWEAARDALMDDISESETQYDETSIEYVEKLQLFDLFFERNALSIIVDMLHGESFTYEKYKAMKSDHQSTSETKTEAKDETTSNNNNNDDVNTSTSSIPENDLLIGGDTRGTLLPSLAVATQALQSISILIQNVSRATSLYAILSNNCINKLIDVPLHLYTVAEKRRLVTTKEAKSLPAIFASPQITELMTHFVTFLKSLALRMNAETLQFFIKYNTNINNNNNNDISYNNTAAIDSDPVTTTIDPVRSDDSTNSFNEGDDILHNVEFPLYVRALEFCAAHHDSFVRTTALNICLNTLRLTTIVEPDTDANNDISDSNERKTEIQHSSPNAILHNAKALPFHERLVIAQYACIPSRVDHLISPIFTKLAERWSALDEQIRLIDMNKHNTGYSDGVDIDTLGERNERVAMAKEKVRRDRLLRNLKETVADLQDELLLLDDVFQVGLTVLNEQLVETMLATFVYPMLLQPLVIYCQRLTALVDEDRFSFTEHPFGRISADLSDVEKSLTEVSGPAKAALYTMASVFKFQSNRPLLRLLFTVLFHPLSPDSTSAPTVRSKLEVASIDSSGRKSIRLDVSYPLGEPVPNERTTYDFGTDPVNRRRAKSSIPYATGGDSEACVFVLAPALAEILEFRGNDISLVARTRPNPYRQAYLKCLNVPEDMSDIRELAVCTFDCALSSFQGNFASSILFGTDVKRFADDIPADERNLDSINAHAQNDRGIGGSSTDNFSRRTFNHQKAGTIGKDLVGEVISSLCSSIVYASRVASDEWKLGYDEVAANVLLTALQHHPESMRAALKIMENRYVQAALSLTEIPSCGLIPMGGSEISLPGSPNVNDPDYEERMFENLLNLVFYDTLHLGGSPVMEEFLVSKESDNYMSRESFSVHVAKICNLDDLCNRVGKLLTTQEHVSELRGFNVEMIEERREGARVWVKIDALVTLLKSISRQDCPSSICNENAVYTNVSKTMTDFFFKDILDNEQLSALALIDLDSSLYIPCVCEVMGQMSQYFVDSTSEVVEQEGVTWQSLYVVIHQTSICSQIGLVQVLPATGGSTGRIISVCSSDRMTVERDESIPSDDSPARRLSLYYKWFDQIPPPLFLFDTIPTLEEKGDSFLEAKSFTSRLDIWLENEYAANQAYEIISNHIFLAKAQRGRRIISFLDPHNERDAL